MTKPVLNFSYTVNAEHAAYLDTCARVRGIAPTSLVKRLVEVICHDQLVLSILDDDSKREIRRGEHSYSGTRGRNRGDPDGI